MHKTVALATLFALLLCLPAAPAAGEKKDDEEQEWDVREPPGTWETVAIDTTETTWSNVDVSPDGRTIVFDMLGDVYRVPIEGGDAEPLAEGIDWSFQPRYSPDGSRIAFISDRGGAANLWIMNADGSEPRAVSDEKTNLVHNPAWSPDGEYIAAKKGFMSTRSIPGGEIWLFHHGGGSGMPLVERPNGDKDQKNIAEPSFSADGRYVYYSQDTTPGARWEYNKDSTGSIFSIKRLDRVTGEIEVFVEGPGGAIRPTPSPDGRMLAFVRRTPALTSALWVKDLESGIERPLYDRLDRDLQETNGSQGNTPAVAWTPDSRALVFWAGGKIRRVDVDSRESEEIPIRVRSERKVHPALRFAVDPTPEEFDVKMLRWAQLSPDGTRAVFQALGHLWVREIESGRQRRLTGQDDHFEQHPAISRDGRWVVYTTWDDEELGSVRIVSIDGGPSRRLTDRPGHYAEPCFSPGGDRVVYRKLTGGYLLSGRWSLDPGLWIVPVAGGGAAERIRRSGRAPHFGADGERVFFTESVEETQLALKSVDLDGHEERTHLKGATVTEMRVSPDGRWVAFTEQFNAFVAPFPRTGKTVDIGPDSEAFPVRQVSKRSGEFLRWSADSRELRWVHGPTLYTRKLEDAFSFLDGAPQELPEPVEEGVPLGFRAKADRPRASIALTGARIVTMRDAEQRREVIENGTVLVRDNRIAAVGPSAEIEIPADAFRLDVTGMTIVPGFVDVHAHGPMARDGIVPEQNWIQLSNLAFGVTTIHDPSNDTDSIFAAAELQRAGAIVAPRIFSTGTILYGAYVPGYTAKIESYDDARFHVRRLRDVGAISVKSYNQPRRDVRQQVIAAGEELGMMVVPEGGAKFDDNMTQIVDGHTGIEHAIPIVRGYEDVKQLWAGTRTGYTPTFGVAYGGISGENYWYDRTDVWRNERLMRYSPRFVIEPRAMRRTKAPDEHYNHIEVARFAKQLRDRGVSVQIGAHGQREGLAAHWEMWMMQQGGFSAWEALRGGTIDGARYIGLDRHLGSIESGKLADLVVIDGNPLENLQRSEYVAYTMLDGRLYDATTMNRVAPDPTERAPLFFRQEGGDTIHPETRTWIDELGRALRWVH